MAKVVVSEQRNKPTRFEEIVRQQVIQPLGLTHTFMGDEMMTEGGQVKVKNRADIRVAQGRDYFQGKVTTGQDFNYDVAAGGAYSSAVDVAKFYRAVANEEIFTRHPERSEGSDYEDETARSKAASAFFDEKNFVLSGGDFAEKYGLGIRKLADDKIEYLHHGGAGLLFYAHAIAHRNIGHPETAKSGVALVSYENLTRPIAAKLLGDEKKNKKGDFEVDRELAAKMDWLDKTFSKDQLISLRQTLENTPEKFSEKFFDEFQKLPKPATSIAPSQVEKMVSKTKSGANEV